MSEITTKQIDQLPEASSVGTEDLFVIKQSGNAKKLPGSAIVTLLGGKAVTENVKTALLNCFSHVAWVDEHGQDYYDALADALAQKEVVSISAVFTQGQATIYDTDSLDTLRQYLVVTATYDDTSTADVTAYTELSGTLTVGTSIITATFSGKTTTFNVTVTENPIPVEYQRVEWVGSTGTGNNDFAYINTGLTESGMSYLNGYTIDMKVACGVPVVVIGANNCGSILFWSTKGGAYFGSIAAGVMAIGQINSYALNVDCTAENVYNFVFSSTGLTVTSGESSVTRTYGTSDTSQTLCIGTGMSQGNVATWTKYIGSIIVKKNGAIVREYYPCYRKADNVIGFYDTVTDAFFVNAGTGGTFIKGEDV